jgi:hypothetical protein
MQMSVIASLGLLVLAGAGGCNKQKSPDVVASDVANAQQKAAAEVADARQDAAKDSGSAAAKVDEKTKDLDDTNAKGAYDVALAKADGDKKIAAEKCLSMAGDAQKACKDQADADYDLARANAKAALAAQRP